MPTIIEQPIVKEGQPSKEPVPDEKASLKAAGSMLDTLNIIAPGILAKPSDPKPETKPETKPEENKEQQKEEPVTKTETKVEPVKTEPTPEEKKTWSSKSREAFDNLEKDRNKHLDTLKAKETEFQQAAAQITELKSKLERASSEAPRIEQYEKQIEKLRSELKAVSVERDPDFVERFVKSRDKRMSELRSLAKNAGATDDDFDRAVRFSDEDQLSEWREALTGRSRVAWDAHFTAIANIEFEKQQALENSEKTYQDIQANRQKAWQQQGETLVKNNMATAQSVETRILENAAFLAETENEPIREALKEALNGVAGGKDAEKWTPEVIMGHVGYAVVQNHLLKIQAKVIEGKDSELKSVTEELEKLKKEIEEKNTFIQSSSNGMPRSDGFSQTPSKNGEKRSMLDDVRIHAPGVS